MMAAQAWQPNDIGRLQLELWEAYQQTIQLK